MTPSLGGPLAWDVNIYFFIFLCLHYSQSPTSYRHIQKAPFCVQFDILLAWKKIGKEIFCFIGMQLRIRRKKRMGPKKKMTQEFMLIKKRVYRLDSNFFRSSYSLDPLFYQNNFSKTCREIFHAFFFASNCCLKHILNKVNNIRKGYSSRTYSSEIVFLCF